MKKCPTCEKTFDDSFKFCQTDGTPLVDEEPALDPYATIVQGPAEPPPAEAAPADVAPAAEEKPAEAPIHQTVGSVPITEPGDVLDLPSNDPLKTVVVSEEELKAAMSGGEQSAETPAEGASAEPPAAETPVAAAPLPEPEPPIFSVPEVAPPSFSDAAPPSPFAASEGAHPPTAPSIEEPIVVPEEPAAATPPAPVETPPATPVAEWTPPPAPVASWENQEIGSNTPLQPPPAGVSGQNKTLAIISLITGVVSVLCCNGIFVMGIAAIILGFMARGKAKSNPTEYGGAGLALGGIITGGISLLLGLLYWIMILAGVIRLPGS